MSTNNKTLFVTAIKDVLNIDLDQGSTRETIFDNIHSSQFIVAGPGTGKTTAMVLRVLYLLYVKNIDPGSIIMTTFTKKAASEMKSRIQDWGEQISSFYEKSGIKMIISLNSIEIGTLDRLIGDWLTQSQMSQGISSSIISNYGTKLIMSKLFLIKNEDEREEIASFLEYLTSENVQSMDDPKGYNWIGRTVNRLRLI